MHKLWQFIKSRPAISGVIIFILGLGLTLEGSWLIWLGGTWYYTFEGVGFMIVGGLLLAGRRSALWVNLAVLVATVIWAFMEVGLRKYGVFALLPRLDLAMIISVWLAMPWVWRRLGPRRAHDPDPAVQPPRQPLKSSTFAGAIIPGVITLALVLTGITDIIQLPQMPAQQIKPNVAFDVPTFGVKPGNWRYYGRTPGGSRFSPLTQITPDNVHNLEVAWKYESGDMKHSEAGMPLFHGETTPTEVGGVLYSCTPNAWVFALDAATGKQLWKYKQTKVDDSKTNIPTCRGVAYYEAPSSYHGKDCKTRIIAPTGGPYIVALDAKTGKVCQDFGDGGMIDLTQHMGGVAPGALVQTSEPLVMHGLVYTGGNVRDNWFKGEPSGVVRAWDAVTGKLVWHWDLGKKDPNAPLDPGEIYTPYTPNAWGNITGDPKLGIIYVPLGNATPDYYGKFRRPFDYEYSGSVVALKADTGEELWHFQQAYKDVYDYDLPVGPSLINWPDGQDGTIPALIQTSKRGVLFVLNRKTGKPLFPIKQKDIADGPKNGVLTKWVSDTQPVQPAMPSFAPERLHEVNMWGLTPYDQIWCRAAFHFLYYDGVATPPTTQGSIMYPTFDGVTDWYGAAIDPAGKMVVISNYLPFVGTLIPRSEAPGKGGIKVVRMDKQGHPPVFFGPYKPQYGLPYAVHMRAFLSPIGAPCNEPPWATLSGINLATKKVEWTIPLGDTRHTAPFGIKQNLPLPTGIFTLGGNVITKSGIVFVSGTADDFIRAFDEDSGQLLWQHGLPAGGNAVPAVYKADGREYLVITAAGHEDLGTFLGDYTIAFALPKNGSD
ncbi:MAG TPA: membrane-bound PQQ-dependent dehydrogenase, glucose/quinate/shikimate family [Gammaproteobacteria bacterium]|nr:membrane-bound PQQ-dependent dehydrogenase, glucose/quinate/shikimate family [Gammaproteobacteria bacterium]